MFLNSACEKKISNAEFEQNVFDEVFPILVDSTIIDQRLYTFFPERGKPIYDKNGKWIGLDSTGQHKRDLEYDIKRALIEKDTLNRVIAIGSGGFINDSTDLEKYQNPKFTFST